MTVNSYFTLATNSNSLNKRFKVITSGYRRSTYKSESISRTLNGQQDVSRGAIYKIHDYMVKVRETEPDSNYGNLSDLEAFFEFNNPNGTPSDQLTLTDHYNNSYTCIFTKDFIPEPLGVMLEGVCAYFIVKCSFEILNLTEAQSEGSGS